MNYFAHTAPGCPETEWEKLAVHLIKVEGHARNHGEGFGAGELAAMAGRLHDLGKYGNDFQARLRDPTRRADHSTAGAIWACRHLPPRWGRLLAHVVAGHHTGLKDNLLGPDGRIETKGDLPAAGSLAACWWRHGSTGSPAAPTPCRNCWRMASRSARPTCLVPTT